MRKKNIFLSYCFLLLYCIVGGQNFSFPAQWKFKMEDKNVFNQEKYHDADWQLVTVPLSWTKLNLNQEKSIGWYRVRVVLPNLLLGKDLVVSLNTINDADEIYFNGVKIGATGKFPPNDQSAWDVERNYVVPKELVKNENLIAIRVYNGSGDGGMMTGSPFITTKSARDKMISEQLKSKKSYYQLTTSNGLTSAVYNEQNNEIENWYPHIFSYYDSALVVKPVLRNLKINTSQKPVATSYLQNTHIIQVKYPSFTVCYFTSFTKENKLLYVVVKGNETTIRNMEVTYSEDAGKINVEKRLIPKKALSEKWFVFGFSDSLHTMPDLKKAASDLSKENLLQKEIQFMQKVFAGCKIPAGLATAEQSAIKQSISILKMSQASDKEIFPFSHGQLLASLRPGVWAIAWVRDAAFAIEAMSKLGMYTEARKALQFMLNATPTNQYIHYTFTDGKDYGIGVPYIISVTRYFGNGREESDYNDSGPNIEIDDFGLFLTALYHYINESGDAAFFEKNAEAINTIGNAIIHNINEKNIIRRESGPWEHHLPGKEFMWTSGVCARGLQLMAELQRKYNIPYQKFEQAYKRLYKGIMQNCLIDGKYIKGNATEQKTSDHHYFDAATFELFANGLITDKNLFLSHMQEYNKRNSINNNPSNGYCRFNSNDSYENQEWPFAGLRVSVAQLQAGNRKEAKKYIDRITSFISRNNNQVPEILSNDMSLYRGAIPMVGYGSGAYVLALLKYYNK